MNSSFYLHVLYLIADVPMLIFKFPLERRDNCIEFSTAVTCTFSGSCGFFLANVNDAVSCFGGRIGATLRLLCELCSCLPFSVRHGKGGNNQLSGRVPKCSVVRVVIIHSVAATTNLPFHC